MSELCTVPFIIYEQGMYGDTEFEIPIIVKYYNGQISIEQEDRSINVNFDHINQLFNEIKKHLPEAKEALRIAREGRS